MKEIPTRSPDEFRALFIKIGLMCDFEETKVGWANLGLIITFGFFVFLFCLGRPNG